MTNGDSRLDRIERILEEMAVRQQYHDEAFERQDGELKRLRELVEIDSQNIRALARIAERHQERLDDLEGQGPA